MPQPIGPDNDWNMAGAVPVIKTAPALALLVDAPFPVWHEGSRAYQMPKQEGANYFVSNPGGLEGWVGVEQFETSYGVVAASQVGQARDESFWRDAEQLDASHCSQVLASRKPADFDPYRPHIVRKLTVVWAKRYEGPDTVLETTEGPMPVVEGDFIFESAASVEKGHRPVDGTRDIWPVKSDFFESSFAPAPAELVARSRTPEAPGV